jgi:phenylalanyl-tRNA synthetase beta chain
MWSLFPFIARDIALWVPENVTAESVAETIKENMGELVVRGPELFDQFKKDGKISYAFRLVFQSKDKTLTDEEVSIPMQKITEKLTSLGFEIR